MLGVPVLKRILLIIANFIFIVISAFASPMLDYIKANKGKVSWGNHSTILLIVLILLILIFIIAAIIASGSSKKKPSKFRKNRK